MRGAGFREAREARSRISRASFLLQSESNRESALRKSRTHRQPCPCRCAVRQRILLCFARPKLPCKPSPRTAMHARRFHRLQFSPTAVPGFVHSHWTFRACGYCKSKSPKVFPEPGKVFALARTGKIGEDVIDAEEKAAL